MILPSAREDGGARAEELPGQVHVDGRAPIGECHLGRRGIALDAGIGHEDVERAEALEHGREQRVDLLFVRDIGLERQRLAAFGGDRRHRCLGARAVALEVQGHRRAGAAQGERDRAADAAAGAGHEGRLALQAQMDVGHRPRCGGVSAAAA
jgi:hypothetical protein